MNSSVQESVNASFSRTSGLIADVERAGAALAEAFRLASVLAFVPSSADRFTVRAAPVGTGDFAIVCSFPAAIGIGRALNRCLRVIHRSRKRTKRGRFFGTLRFEVLCYETTGERTRIR